VKNTEPIDDTDRKILERLKKNARESISDTAKGVPLSESAVRKRIKRMEDAGVIGGYTVAVRNAALEETVEAYIELSFDGKADVHSELGEFIKRPEVREAITIAGDLDALLRVRVKTTAELGRLAMDLRGHERVTKTRTLIALDRWWHGAPLIDNSTTEADSSA
jgi:Lrp/AsnC family leucine-responsive transcriptional regulator